jgi:ornithine cyclodeaminase/alanine dehydrogenase-like protein (mu-crystallin family)
MRILTDRDVAQVSPAAAVDAAREALRQFGVGESAAPARVRSSLGDLGYVFTVGALADGTSGFRVYRTGQPAGDQVTVVWDPAGRIAGFVVGEELGARRTGALGGVAADLLARPDASRVAVIGAGVQAWTQLWALTGVRRLDLVRVFSPTAANRERFAARASSELGLTAEVAGDPAAALRDADLVVLATRSTTPVIDARDVPAGAHVATVGPKLAGGHETPLELVAAAAVVACDSPQQATAYPEPFFTQPEALVSLSEVLLGRAPGRRSPEDITLYCSVGLAGSEVLLAQRLLKS